MNQNRPHHGAGVQNVQNFIAFLRRCGLQFSNGLNARWCQQYEVDEGKFLNLLIEHRILTKAQAQKFLEAWQIHGGQIGPYLIGRELGRGAMGAVYAGLDPKLNRQVAVKVVHGGLASEEDMNLFISEAKTMARLTHGNVVVIYDAGISGNTPYIAMQFVEGTTLEGAAFKRPLEKRVELFGEIVRGVAALHANGIVHRDLKPDNVMIEKRTGRAVVMDLGLAVPVTAQQDDPSKIFGTPGYMSPEQARGQQVGPYSDVYALGRILLRMLFGHPRDLFAGMLHRGNSLTAILVAIGDELERDSPPAQIREWMTAAELPDGLIQIAERCLHPRPEERYRDAGQLVKALEGYSEEQKAEEVRLEEKRKQELKEEQEKHGRQKKIAFAVLVILVLICALAVNAYLESEQAKEAAEAAAAAEQKAKLEAESRADAEARAAAEARERAELERKQKRVSSNLANAYTAMNNADWKRARDFLLSAVELDPDNKQGRVLLAKVLLILEDARHMVHHQWLADHSDGQQRQDYLLFALFGLDIYANEQPLELFREKRAELEPKLREQLEGKNRQLGEAIRLFYDASEDQLARNEAAYTKKQARFQGVALGLADQQWDSWVQEYILGFLIGRRAPQVAFKLICSSAARNPEFHMTLQWRMELRKLIATRQWLLAKRLQKHAEKLQKQKKPTQEIELLIKKAWNLRMLARAHFEAALQDLERLQILKPGHPVIDLRHAQVLIDSVLMEPEKKKQLLARAEALLEECRRRIYEPEHRSHHADFEKALKLLQAQRNQ